MKKPQRKNYKVKSNSKLSYKVIFIDWNGTLSGSKFWWHLENPNHPNHNLFPQIEATLFGELRYLLTPWMRGDFHTEDVIAKIAEEAKLDYKFLLEEFIRSCQTMQFSTQKLPDLVKQLQKAGLRVVIATDNMDSFPRWTVPALKLSDIFDDILDSHTLKAMKGDFDKEGRSLFFEKYLKGYDIKHGESVLIDDSEDKGNKIVSIGITYRKIKPVVGLKSELQLLINSFR